MTEDEVAGKVAASTKPPESTAETRAEIAYMWVGPVISFAVIVGFFFMLYSLLKGSADMSKLTDIKDVLFTLLGALGAAFTQVVNYWLGSSKGSADKTALLNKA